MTRCQSRDTARRRPVGRQLVEHETTLADRRPSRPACRLRLAAGNREGEREGSEEDGHREHEGQDLAEHVWHALHTHCYGTGPPVPSGSPKSPYFPKVGLSHPTPASRDVRFTQATLTRVTASHPLKNIAAFALGVCLDAMAAGQQVPLTVRCGADAGWADTTGLAEDRFVFPLDAGGVALQHCRHLLRSSTGCSVGDSDIWVFPSASRVTVITVAVSCTLGAARIAWSGAVRGC